MCWKLNLLVALAVLFGGCGDCNREVSDVPYNGNPAALDPYVEATDLHSDPGSCDTMGCNYFFYGTAWLHNPTSDPFTTDIRCEFWDDNYLIGDSVRVGVTIDASRSKEFEFREQYTTPDAATIVFDCDLE